MKKCPIIFVMLIVFVASIASCIPSPPRPGFRISTTVTLPGPFGFPSTRHYHDAPIFGTLQASRPDLGAVTGNVQNFLGNTGSGAYYDVHGGVAPANYNMGFGPNAQFCPGRVGAVTIVRAGEDYGLDCQVIPILFFIASPAVIDLDYPPPSVTISGSGISSSGGMPSIEYYNSSGGLVAQGYASEVAADGTWLTSSTPNLSSVSSGRYLLVIRNPDGVVAGNTFVDVFRFVEPPPPPDPDPCGEGPNVCIML